MQEAAQKTGSKLTLPGLKAMFRMVQKSTLVDPKLGRIKGDCSYICDVNRGLLEVEQFGDMHRALDHFRTQESLGNIKVLAVKDRATTPTDAGWSDVLLVFCELSCVCMRVCACARVRVRFGVDAWHGMMWHGMAWHGMLLAM